MKNHLLARGVRLRIFWCRFLVLSILGCFGIGCVSSGRLLTQSAIQKLREGQPRNEVLQIFGEPEELIKGEGSHVLFLYRYFDVPIGASSPGGIISPGRDEAKVRTLSVLFNEQDQVEKYLFSESKPNLSRMTGRLGYPISAEALSKIEPQKTTRQDLVARFGPPIAEELTLRGVRKLIWVYIEYMATGVQQQGVEVLLDDGDRVVSFRRTNSDARR